jgi:hypothetical protein
MKIKTESYNEFVGRVEKWHNWFAWRPVSVDGHIVWLENIERRSGLRINKTVYEWEYRIKES